MTNKYFEIAKKTTIDFKEGRISVLEFKETFEKLDKVEIYKDLDKNECKGISNYISAVAELEDQNTLESQWIVETINLFYCYFIDNYDYIYAKDFYRFLKFGLEKENKNPVKISFKNAIESYLDNKISGECLVYIANEFLNNLKFFQEEINKDKKLLNILNISLKLKFNRILEDLNPGELKIKQKIDIDLSNYLKY